MTISYLPIQSFRRFFRFMSTMAVLFVLMLLINDGLYAQQTYSIKVVINNVEHATGKLRLALYDSASANRFPEEDGATYGQEVPSAPGTVTMSFSGVAPGVYAIAAYHDENKNGVMDTRIFGIPTESYGFSNNPVTTFGPPSFEGASFTVEGHTSITINLR